MYCGHVSGAASQSHGPVFLLEPPAHLTFSNTSGSQVSCSAHGSPTPQVDWLLQDGQTVTAVPGLRYVISFINRQASQPHKINPLIYDKKVNDMGYKFILYLDSCIKYICIYRVATNSCTVA
ncbi:I-set domain containing protein [Asbolus verrucosus]|uniref:I-set domain containing protein n=1 Tax=Asbolus verrucosus TaxID=1661398 RepID=A0A482VXT1_ASBVE|nr:I-set domain containing protein [Asbolus verrucosus]